MRVEQQIEWNKRLWCTNAWGLEIHLIQELIDIYVIFMEFLFYLFFLMSFSKACSLAIEEIQKKYAGESIPYAFTYDN